MNQCKRILQLYFLPDKTDKIWFLKCFLSLILPALVLILHPIGLDGRQSAVAAGVLLVVIWWSSGVIKKIPASIFLILVFLFVSGAGAEKVFAFPLSETFPMIVITYLFSQAIANAGLIDRIFQPLLLRFVHTPLMCILAILLFFFLTMYVIPQPLARLIIAATVFSQFLKHTDLPEKTQSVLMYAVFLMYAVVNMSAKDADLIMNHVAAGFAGTEITNGMWVRAMLPPTLVCCALLIGALLLLFHRELLGIRLCARQTAEISAAQNPGGFTRRQKAALAIIIATVVLWMTSSIHGINNTLITIVGTVLLFAVGVLHREDFRTIDVPTLIFLTAAFAIGGVMQACGAADKVFGILQGIFPAQFSPLYLCMMILVAMALHMVLGSNTTTLSIVVPGMMLLCGNVVSDEVIVYTAILSVSFHAFLPFHSVAIMIGSSNGYFPASYVTKMGLIQTVIVFFTACAVFLPYWQFLGLL